MQVSEQRQIGYTLSGSLCSCVYLSKACSFPILGPVTVCCTCLPLGAQPCQGKQSSWVCEGLAVSWAIEVTLMCVEIKMMLCVSVFAWCVTFLPRVALAVWGLDAACGCQLLFFRLSLSDPMTLTFYSVPFRLKILWLELVVLATAECLSTWLNCKRKEEAENEIWSQHGMGEGWKSGIVLQLPSVSPLKSILGNSQLLRIFSVAEMIDNYKMNRGQCILKNMGYAFFLFFFFFL